MAARGAANKPDQDAKLVGAGFLHLIGAPTSWDARTMTLGAVSIDDYLDRAGRSQRSGRANGRSEVTADLLAVARFAATTAAGVSGGRGALTTGRGRLANAFPQHDGLIVGAPYVHLIGAPTHWSVAQSIPDGLTDSKGTAVGRSGASGALSTTVAVNPQTAVGVATASGTVLVARGVEGTASGTSTTTGVPILRHGVQGQAAAGSTVTLDARLRYRISGRADGVASVAPAVLSSAVALLPPSSSTPTLRAKNQHVVTQQTNLQEVVIPTATEPGDLILLFAGTYANDFTAVPPGFTLLSSVEAMGGTFVDYSRLWWKLADAADKGRAVRVDVPNWAYFGAVVLVFKDVDQIDPFKGNYAAAGNGNSLDLDVPSFTMDEPGIRVYFGSQMSTGGTSSNWSSGTPNFVRQSQTVGFYGNYHSTASFVGNTLDGSAGVFDMNVNSTGSNGRHAVAIGGIVTSPVISGSSQLDGDVSRERGMTADVLGSAEVTAGVTEDTRRDPLTARTVRGGSFVTRATLTVESTIPPEVPEPIIYDRGELVAASRLSFDL